MSTWIQRIATIGVLSSVASLANADTAAAPDRPALFCVFPESKPLPECFKGSATSEKAVLACDQRNARRKKVPPRFRIRDGEWTEFAADRWRCVAVPVDKSFRFQIENHGRLYYSDRTSVPADCATRRIDLTRANFYGAMWASCSKRTADRDDIVAPVR